MLGWLAALAGWQVGRVLLARELTLLRLEKMAPSEVYRLGWLAGLVGWEGFAGRKVNIVESGKADPTRNLQDFAGQKVDIGKSGNLCPRNLQACLACRFGTLAS